MPTYTLTLDDAAPLTLAAADVIDVKRHFDGPELMHPSSIRVGDRVSVGGLFVCVVAIEKK